MKFVQRALAGSSLPPRNQDLRLALFLFSPSARECGHVLVFNTGHHSFFDSSRKFVFRFDGRRWFRGVIYIE
jgi:hypothetical protein